MYIVVDDSAGFTAQVLYKSKDGKAIKIFGSSSEFVGEKGPKVPGVKDPPVTGSPFDYDNRLFSKDFISAFKLNDVPVH